jgi:tRNA U34 5-carboxymethylaminomethyl modifying enzyme MnmG/GidA
LAVLRNTLDNTRFKRSSVEHAGISQVLGADLGDSFNLSQLAMRQGVAPSLILQLLPKELRGTVRESELDTALADSLYSGYIEKQKLATDRVNHHDGLKVPESFEFKHIGGLSNEMVERLERARPRNFGQVRNISGLTPTAISTVLVHLAAQKPEQTTPETGG